MTLWNELGLRGPAQALEGVFFIDTLLTPTIDSIMVAWFLDDYLDLQLRYFAFGMYKYSFIAVSKQKKNAKGLWGPAQACEG